VDRPAGLRRPYTVAVFSALIFIAGLLSVTRMRTDIFPSIDIPVVVVVWNYPGLSAEDMERRIVLISERAYSTTVDGITHIESQSISGVGLLKLYFEAGRGPRHRHRPDHRRVAHRQPDHAPRDPAPQRAPVQRRQRPGRADQRLQQHRWRAAAVRLRPELPPGPPLHHPRHLHPGPYGGKQRQIMVDVDPSATAAKGLSPNDVVQALLQSNVIIPAGTAQIGSTEYNVKLNSSPTTVDQFNSIPVKVVNGAPVLLRDVAHVRDGYAVQQNLVHIDGKRASYIVILKHSNAGTLAVVDGVKDLLPSIQSAAPEGDHPQARLRPVDLRPRRAEERAPRGGHQLDPGLADDPLLPGELPERGHRLQLHPLAILVGIAGLFLTGNTLNLMTLGGLALAIGMLVDDATVAVESIHGTTPPGSG
jgi:multidrug efflux pump subunit AcrB